MHVVRLSVCPSVCDVGGSGRVVLVVALVERWTRNRKVAGSTPGRGAIKCKIWRTITSLINLLNKFYLNRYAQLNK